MNNPYDGCEVIHEDQKMEEAPSSRVGAHESEDGSMKLSPSWR